jgi:hypothetical protein
MPKTTRRPPPRTPEEQENYMISIAEKAAEQKILEGSAPSQLLVHYLKLATVKEQLEKEKLEKEIELLRAKTEAIEAEKNMSEMYQEAIKAFGIYTGGSSIEESDDEYYD